MTPQDEVLTDLIRRAREGSKSAAEEMHALFTRHIVKAVRYRLHHRLRSRFDSSDFVQDVWMSFFHHCTSTQVFNTADDLVKFLTRVARNKVAQVARAHMQRQKLNINREVPLEFVPEAGIPRAQGSPSEGLKNHEEWLKFLESLPLVHRLIFLLWREGKSNHEIAEKLDLSDRTVQRVLCKFITKDQP